MTVGYNSCFCFTDWVVKDKEVSGCFEHPLIDTKLSIYLFFFRKYSKSEVYFLLNKNSLAELILIITFLDVGNRIVDLGS